MAKIIYQDGEITKEWEVEMSADDLEARLAVQPCEVELDEGVTAVMFAHPDTVEMIKACKRKSVAKEAGDDDEPKGDDEKVKKLLALLEEVESEDEEEDDEGEETEKQAELMEMLKSLTEAVAELQKEIKVLKEGEITKESKRQPVILKSAQPYERVQKFEGETTEKEASETEGALSHLSEFQKALLKEWGII